MKHSKLILLSCLFLFSGLITLHAQDAEKKLPRYAVSVEPFYLYNGGLRLNVEKRLSDKEWLELNITGYHLSHRDIRANNFLWWSYEEGGHFTSNSDFEQFSGLKGLGIGSTYKKYFYGTCFVSTSASYAYYNVEYPAWNFHPYVEEDLTFYEYGLKDTHQHFNKIAGNLCIGAHSSFRHAYSIEFYGGLGYAHSFYNQDKKAYNETVFGFGYRGIHPVFGMKIGFNIK
ncbi:hypothetical protein FACS189437_06140 [Bacteroidia bacterium]|nr:hypothetical protein FACS189437_06140 [Bacteroidia bacterium]